MNRQGEREVPPRFEDSISGSGKNSWKYEIEAKSGSYRDSWQVILKRTPERGASDAATTITRFYFYIGTKNSHPSCDLVQVDYQSPDSALSGKYDAERCIGLFDSKAATGPVRSNIQKDCSFGLRYFSSLKIR
jgi:hypothetical protein